MQSFIVQEIVRPFNFGSQSSLFSRALRHLLHLIMKTPERSRTSRVTDNLRGRPRGSGSRSKFKVIGDVKVISDVKVKGPFFGYGLRDTQIHTKNQGRRSNSLVVRVLTHRHTETHTAPIL